MCPRFSSEDPHLDMSLETFARIHQAMKYAHTVDFTGWGEPLLHRKIFEMIRMAGERGCLTTMTSNGTALNKRNGLALIEAGLDRLVVSVDGVRAETYDPIRIGASFEKLSERVAGLASLISESGSPLELGIAFTIQEENAADLELVVPWMNSVGVAVLHLKHLNVVSNSNDWEKSYLKHVSSPLPVDENPLLELEAKIHQLRNGAERDGIRVEVHSEFPLSKEMVGRHCLATPLDSVYFSYEGRVAPCCHFGHHVSRFFEGQLYPASSLFFGDIHRQTLNEIWNSSPFRSFRAGFETRQYPEECRNCYLLYGK